MKLDRDHSENRPDTAVIGNKVHAFLGAADATEIECRVSTTSQSNGFIHEAVLVEVDKVCNKVRLINLLLQLAPLFPSYAAWVFLCARLKNSFLKLPVQFHVSGLRGLFLWKAKAITDAPDTYNA